MEHRKEHRVSKQLYVQLRAGREKLDRDISGEAALK